MLIRPAKDSDRLALIALWQRCGLVVPWTDPERDIARKGEMQDELFLVGMLDDFLVASVMAGYDGHRGWLYYLAVDPAVQRRGFGRKLVNDVLERLQTMGCSKVNLQVRTTNTDVLVFYGRLGFIRDDVISLGKPLMTDR